jgi:pantoate--beta-alanine ligase
MQRLTSPVAMRTWSDDQRGRGQRLAMVPTMGALHEGHLHLVDVARQHADVVIVSVFVNALQFNRSDDFDAYPRPIDDDADVSAAAGVDALYIPTVASMYPDGFDTHVVPGRLAEPMEGSARPGHFRGVATVVAKLFNAAVPHAAVFGEKDYQQLAIVRRMVTDLDMGVEIVGVPTVREEDGLALSSRNRRLTPRQRAAAVCIPRALRAAAQLHASGERDPERLRGVVASCIAAEPLARLEYVDVVHPMTLCSLDDAAHAVVALAVWFDDVRLIDNIVLPSA